MLDPLYAAIGWLLSVFYSIIPSLGIAIILLTCTVMLLLLPLTAKQTRSMIAMQRIQPEIKKIQQQYKDDRQKQNEALMRFYQENNINPLAGCLPMLVQMPIFIALFGVLRNIQDHVPTTGRLGDLYRDICHGVAASACTPKGIYFLGMDLTTSPADSAGVTDGFIERIPYLLAVALVVVLGWYQMWQTQRRQQRSGTMQNNPVAKQMQVMTRVFPLLFGWFAWIASSGLVVYFATSSLWRIGQQHLVLNRYYDEAAAEKAGERGAPGTKAPPRPEAAPAAGSDNGTRDAGSPARSGPSPHASRKKRKRRR